MKKNGNSYKANINREVSILKKSVVVGVVEQNRPPLVSHVEVPGVESCLCF